MNKKTYVLEELQPEVMEKIVGGQTASEYNWQENMTNLMVQYSGGAANTGSFWGAYSTNYQLYNQQTGGDYTQLWNFLTGIAGNIADPFGNFISMTFANLAENAGLPSSIGGILGSVLTNFDVANPADSVWYAFQFQQWWSHADSTAKQNWLNQNYGTFNSDNFNVNTIVWPWQTTPSDGTATNR
jgi:hypothetical protein